MSSFAGKLFLPEYTPPKKEEVIPASNISFSTVYHVPTWNVVINYGDVASYNFSLQSTFSFTGGISQHYNC
jgi:hypothetical protein